MILDLTEDEAILLDALAKYATTQIKPPMTATKEDCIMIGGIAEEIAVLAPAEVMQSLAGKLVVLVPSQIRRMARMLDWRKSVNG